jgi:hypothetical protein
MSDRDRVLAAVYAAVDDLNLQLPPASRLAKSEATAITGDAAALDSLGFLNLILAAETQVNARAASPINLAESLTENEERGLPATLGALVGYIVELQGS